MLRFNNYPPTSTEDIELTNYGDLALSRAGVGSRDDADKTFGLLARIIGSDIAATGAANPEELAREFAAGAFLTSVTPAGLIVRHSFSVDKFADAAADGVTYELDALEQEALASMRRRA
jgi:hypothetical protein